MSLLPLPRIGQAAPTSRSIADILQAHAVAAGFDWRDGAGHSLKRGTLTTGTDRGVHPAKLTLGQHKSFDVPGEYLEAKKPPFRHGEAWTVRYFGHRERPDPDWQPM